MFAAGKVVSAMDVLRLLALGADATYAARSFMMSVGCIQAQLCHTNACPTGIATQDPGLNRGLDPNDKGPRAAHYHKETLRTLMELTGALGLDDPREVTPDRVRRRVAVGEVRTLAEIHHFTASGSLLDRSAVPALQEDWDRAQIGSWAPI